MKYLGNIVTDNKITGVDCYNVVKSFDKIIKDIPTLIIGYKKVSSIYSEFSMLDWKIDDNIYWTYGRRERGDKYIEHLEKFKNLCLENITDTVEYRLFNVLVEPIERKKLFFEFMKSSENKTIYFDNDMVYIYSDNKHVYGLSLRDIDYCGGNRNKTLSILLHGNNNVISGKEVYKNEFGFILKDMPYIIPYLYS